MARKILQLDPAHVENILATVGRATSEQHQAGLDWYADYSRYIVLSAKRANVNQRTARALFAWFSANKGLDHNNRMFVAWLAGGMDEVHQLSGHQRRVATLLAAGTDPESLFTTAPKVRAFYRNLGGSTEDATIDRHCVAVAHNNRAVSAVSLAVFVQLTLAYQRAACLLGLETRQVQAIAWIVWRAEKPTRKGTTRAGDPDLAGLLASFLATAPAL